MLGRSGSSHRWKRGIRGIRGQRIRQGDLHTNANQKGFVGAFGTGKGGLTRAGLADLTTRSLATDVIAVEPGWTAFVPYALDFAHIARRLALEKTLLLERR
jgi:hypothetical protein